LTIKTDILPAIALLAAGTILATGFGRVLYQKALTVTDNNNGFVSIFFLLIPAFTCLLSLWMSRWISELKFAVGPFSSSALGSSPPPYWCSYGNHKTAAPIGRPSEKWT
jgi:hypothetical protein